MSANAVAAPPQAEPPGSPPESAPAPAPTPARVRVTLVGLRGKPTLAPKIAAWFVGTDTVFSSSTAATLDRERLLEHGDPGIHVYVTSSGGAARVYFHEVQADGAHRYLVREVPLQHDLDEVDQEALALVVYKASLAIHAGRASTPKAVVAEKATADPAVAAFPVEAAPAPAATPAPTPSPAPSTPPEVTPPPAEATPPVAAPPATTGQPDGFMEPDRGARPRDPSREEPSGDGPRLELTANLGYRLRARGVEGPAHGPFVAVGLRVPLSRELSLVPRVGGSLLVRTTARIGDLDVRLSGTGAQLGAAVIADRGGWSLTGSVDVLGERLTVEPRVTAGATTTPGPKTADWRPSVMVGAGARVPVAGAFLFGALSATLQLRDVDYSRFRGDREEPVDGPWLVQPGGRLGIAW